MAKIGILGGSFDPIHNTHIRMAQMAKQIFGLDCVLLMPSKKPPHKYEKGITSEEDRLNMVRLAVENIPGLEASDIELKREGYTYTADTLCEIKKSNPSDELYFLIGEDSLMYIDEWFKPDVIFANATILAFARGMESLHKLDEKIGSIKKIFENAVIETVPFEADDVSSSMIRDLVRSHDADSYRTMIDPKVAEYIEKKGLYKEAQNMYSEQETIDNLTEMVKGILKPSRFNHSLGVAYTAASLAMRYGADVYKARVAGILHDCAKYLSAEDQLAFRKEKGLPVNDAEEKNPQLLHSKNGAYFAKVKYGINDEDIINAIDYHTTGRENMSLLEKIIFLADYMEPNRKDIPGLKEIRAVAFTDLDKACMLACENTIKYLKSLNAVIDEQTIKTYEYLKENYKER